MAMRRELGGTVAAGTYNLYEKEPATGHYFSIDGSTLDSTHTKVEPVISPLNAQNYVVEGRITSGSSLTVTLTAVYEYGSDS